MLCLAAGGRLARFCVHTNHHEVHSMSNMIPLSDLLKSPHLYPAMWRTLLNFLRLTYRLPRMQSHAQRLWHLGNCQRSSRISVTLVPCWRQGGDVDVAPMVTLTGSESHSFTQQTLTEDRVLHQALDIVKMWGALLEHSI